eukprot:gene27846-34626_t
MTITKRLMLTLSVALLALLFVGGNGVLQLQRAQARLDTVQTELIPSIAGLNMAKNAVSDSRLAGYRLSVFSAPAPAECPDPCKMPDKASLLKAYNDAHAKFDEILAKYEKENVTDDTDRKMVEADREAMASYRKALVPFLEASHAGDMDGVRATLIGGSPLAIGAAGVKKALDDHIAYNNTLIDKVRTESIAAYKSAFTLLLGVIVAALVVTGFLGYQLYRIISGSLSNIQGTLEGVSQSLDLTQQVRVERMDEHYFDGLAMLRSHDNYVAQWGDPDEKTPRPFKTAKARLAGEFTVPMSNDKQFTLLPDRDGYAAQVGHSNGFPSARDPKTGRAWLAHCYGMVGVGRDVDSDSANGSSLYAVTGHAPRHLDRNITVVGRVVSGMPLLSSLPRGSGALGFYEKAEQRTPIKSVRLAADVPEAERVKLEVMRTDSASFKAVAEAQRNRGGPWTKVPSGYVELCNVTIPVREVK